MAGTILTSAFVFHAAIDGQPRIPRVRRLLPPNRLTQSKLLSAWTEILKVNYWPIFSIARAVAEPMPARSFADTLAPVRQGVEELAAIGATTVASSGCSRRGEIGTVDCGGVPPSRAMIRK